MDLYKYRRRLKRETSMQGMEDSTKSIVNNTFHESPNYREVFLNGIKFDARVSVEEDETKKTVLFRPNTEIYKGDIIDYEGTHWLVNNTYDNDIYPTAFVDFCNEWLRWTDNTGKILAYPCVVKGKEFVLEESKYFTFSEDVINIKTPYNEHTKNIKNLQRFILNGKPYKIEGIDVITNISLGKGFIEMRGTLDFLETNDNLVDEVADNDNNGWGDW